MSYHSLTPATRMLYLATSCPYLVARTHCVGGDYCPFPPGNEQLCCFWCPKFEDCPDATGVCQRFTG